VSDLVLRPYRIEDEPEAVLAHHELVRDDFHFLLFRENSGTWSEFVERSRLDALGIDLPADRVRNAQLVAEVDGQLVGRTSIRFELNEWLLERGGHIGYAVRPAHRRRGYAGEILRQALVIIRAAGVRDVLVCCDDTNVASAAVIEGAGGALQNVVTLEDGHLVRRYWIGIGS
jgi:predicted acetyltransferase